MAIGENVARVVTYLDKDVLEKVDKLCSELNLSRSCVLAACIESGLEELNFFRFLGLPPRRLQRIGEMLVKAGLMKPQNAHLDSAEIWQLEENEKDSKNG